MKKSIREIERRTRGRDNVITIADRSGIKLIKVSDLLANDRDWQGDALHISTRQAQAARNGERAVNDELFEMRRAG